MLFWEVGNVLGDKRLNFFGRLARGNEMEIKIGGGGLEMMKYYHSAHNSTVRTISI